MTTEAQPGTPAPTDACPVRTFNYLENRPVGEWFPTYDRFRDEAPVYWNGYQSGFFTVVSHAGIMEILSESETFSNSVVTPLDPNPPVKWIPEMLDGEEHREWRKLLGPLFSPRAMAALDDKVEERAIEIIDRIVRDSDGATDFRDSFAQRFPTTVFLELLGLPVDELPTFLEWEQDIIHASDPDPEDRKNTQMNAMMAVMGRFMELIAERRINPGDDIVSKALEFQIDGEPVKEEDLLSFCLLMFMAGLDTVTATLGYIFHHLATHPEDRQALLDDPGKIPAAVEEFLRVYAITQSARKVTRDTVIEGCPMKAGDMVAIPLVAANRDGAAFPDADRVDITRSPNHHIGFGAGPHRCLGSHLARRELQVAIREWLKRIPDFRVPEGAEISETGGMFGLTSLPLEWDTARP